MSESTPHCSFCGVDQSPTIPLITGAGGHICEACVQLASQVVSNWGRKRALTDLQGPLPTPRGIKQRLDEYVIGQDLAKEILAVAVYNHYKRLRNESGDTAFGHLHQDVEIGKSNILLIGPTGTGKTLLCGTLAKIVGVPFVVADATTLTQAGYVGDDVENILVRLLDVAEGNVNRAEWGIVYIDEIDKLARTLEVSIGARDISGEGVQQALLRLVEGAQVKVSVKGRRREGNHSSGDDVIINTRNILFIAGGAFPGMEQHIQSRTGHDKKLFGFTAEQDQAARHTDPEMLLAEIQPQDLRRFGMIPEFIGRFPVLAPLHPLDEAALIQILTEPRDALVRQYQKLFAFEGVALEFTQDAYTSIARKALERGTGARGLRSILEHTLRRTMFDLPSETDVTRCIVSAETIDQQQPIELIRASDERSDHAIPPSRSQASG